jgi:quercetin dioxygenase-like cupin family protein
MFLSDKIEIVHLTMKPGELMNMHLQPLDVIFYVLYGNGILHSDQEDIEGIENTAIFVPAGTPRGWENTGNADFKVIVIKDLA